MKTQRDFLILIDMMSAAQKKIKETIVKHGLIRKKGHVVIGLSGGPDSMCLFHVLYGMRDELGITVSAVHLNHKFRPGHAEEDQEFVENLCEELGIYCYSKTVDVNDAAAQRGETPEEAGRNERYIAFDEEAQRVADSGVPKEDITIAVAQNRNDQVETVLMRIMRGTGPDGLAGIPYLRKSKEGFDIIRPLLDTDRKDIEDYCDSKGLNPRIDHTNSETEYNRNRIRLDLLPKIKSEYNYNIEEAVLRLSELAEADKKYFDGIAEDFLGENWVYTIGDEGEVTKGKLKVELLTSLQPPISHRIIISAMKKMGLTQGLEAVHVDAAISAIKKNETGKIVEFPFGYKMKISYGEAEFYNDLGSFEAKKNDELNITIEIDELDSKEEFRFPGGRLVMKKSMAPQDLQNRFVLALDPKEIKKAGGILEIRYRKPGDRIFLKGINGTKKLQDLFVDEKIPREERSKIPLIVSDNEILWVIGIRKSDKFTNFDGAKECLLLEWMPNS